MKRNKWQRLATIGLCSSLVINAFSGVTAVAETVTIESSPTAESSAKEETQASSVKEETTKASTENSQVTTDTSQEEATEEAEKQAETEVKEEQKEEPQAEVEQEETATSEVVQPNPLPTPVGGISTRAAGNLSTAYQQFINIRNSFSTTSVKTQIITPNVLLGINLTDSAGRAVNTSDFGINATISGVSAYYYPDQKIYRYYTVTPVSITSTKDANGFLLNIPAKDAQAQASASYTRMIYTYFLKDVNLSVPKYVSSVNVREALAPLIIERAQYPYIYPSNIKLNIRKINSQNYSVATNPLPGDAYATSEGSYFNDASYIYRATVDNHYDVNTLNSFSVIIPQKDLKLSIDYKQVTEKFVNTSGVAITPPTGFTQNKQTPMTSNNFTFKQAGTLPDTYTTGGKTYKFKGWYKGKTKPSTLTTTKAPSYAVTYDGNDDLNVVYEEVIARAFPAQTYQFGFVNEAGQLINPASIPITYDYAKGSWTTTMSNFRWTMVPGSASTVGNLKNVTMPAASIATPPGPTYAGNAEVYANFSIKIPRYYLSMSLYDRTGKINPTYPLPSIAHIGGNAYTFTQADVISWLGLTSKGNNMYTLKETYYNGDPAALKFPIFMMRHNEFHTKGSLTQYTTVNRPIYYHLTNRKVTENFVDPSGAKITAPSGFTQGKQTVINSDPYTFKQAGTLPDTYTTGGKTYKFKGWYKGKTKPSTLTTTKAPSYPVTYDDNDDLNVVYEETKEKTAMIPAVTYKFGFVDEKGALVAPANFNMTTNLTTIMNGTPKQVGTAGGVNNGNLKQLTIPSQQLTYTPTVSPAFSGTTNFRLVVPKQYKLPTVTPGTYYTGSSTTYPIATTRFRYVGGVLPDSRLETDGKEYRLSATTTAHSYQMYRDYWIPDTTKTYFSGALSRASAEGNTPAYYTTDETMYYFLENRRVTENFVDTSGAKITAPTGFTQGKKTVIDSSTYHFKMAKELPYSYYANEKAYQFKGWYKGKTKPAKLETTRTPEYDVSYNDEDDVTIIYEEIKYGGNTVKFGFVGEDGQLINPTDFKVTTDVVQTIDGVSTTLNTLTAGNATGNLKTMTIPQKTYPLGTTANYFGTKNSLIEIPRQYLNITFKKPTDYQGKEYPVAERVEHMFTGAPYTDPAEPLYYTVTRVKNQQYKLREITWEETNQAFSSLYKTTLIRSSTTPSGVEMYPAGTIYYYLKNRRVTENFVDTNGAKITPPTGFTQGKQTVINSDPYTFKQAGTLPDTYTAGGKTYKFKGWYKGKSIPNTLTTTKAPSYAVTYDDNDDLNVVYQEEVPKASVALTRTTAETVTSGGNVTWRATITNPSKAPLTTATIKKSTAWSTGLAAPTSMIVTPVGGTAKTVPVTATTWTNGVSLGIDIPAGKTATVQFTTKATGTAGQVLRAGITTSGNYSGVSASATVRVKDNDQEIVTPTTEGFISVPTFDFGQVGVAGTKQQHSLKKAADYYGNGTRNPYLRIKKTQPNWRLTAQLSQPKSATDSLPTATRLLLGAAPVSSFANYNLPTELKNAVGTTSAISLTANNTATSIIANQQFTGSNVYQLDFTFNNVKLEVPANQGVKGQQYKAAVTWNLVTGP
ncbi:WxL domain-containing protein [Enterococcus faecalis]